MATRTTPTTSRLLRLASSRAARTPQANTTVVPLRDGGISGRHGSLVARLPPLTGSWADDGLTRYEVDMFDAVSWVSRYFTLMREDLTAHRNRFVPPNVAVAPVVVESRYEYTYDFTKPPPRNATAVLRVPVTMLPLASDAARQRLRHLAGSAHDPVADVIEIVAETPPERRLASPNDDWIENRFQLFGALNTLIAAAKDPVAAANAANHIATRDAASQADISGTSPPTNLSEVSNATKVDALAQHPVIYHSRKRPNLQFPSNWKLNTN